MHNPRASCLLTPPPDSHVTLQRPPDVPNPSPQKKQRFLAFIRSRPSRKRLDRSKQPEPPAEQVVPETSEAFPDPREDFIGEYGGNEGNELDQVSSQDVVEYVQHDVEGISPTAPAMDSVNSYEVFTEAVATEAIPFFQLVSDLYIVTGWDSRLAKRTTFWYHIQMDRNESGVKIPVCYCPSARKTGICVHQRYLNEEGSLESWTSEGPVAHVILFWRDVVEEGWMNLFSVCIDGLPSVAKHRVVVTYAGADTGFGNWKCSRDGINRCAHVQKYQVYLGQLLTANPQVMSDHGYSMAITDQVHAKAVVESNRHCISYLPVMVSDWAQIPSDQVLYPVPPPVDRVPELLTLTREARCSCGHQFHQESDIFERPCTVYTLLQPISTHIQLQKCPSCKSICYPSKAIGPDCRELGIFNFNNSLLFSHDLLDEYTSSFTSSETSFSSWILVLARRYRKWSPPGLQQLFVEESVFRKVWFGYVDLLDLSNDMVCPRCGPTPEAIIWDGVMLAYGKKQVLETIYPPTSKHHDAVVRDLRYPKNQYLIEDVRLRKLLSSIMSAPLSLPNIFSRNNDTTIDVSVVEATIKKLREVEEAIQLVGKKCGGLHYLLISYYGAVQLKTKGEPAVEARRLFAQISTNESCFQIINRPALKALQSFLNRPSYEALPRLSSIPCMYHLAVHQWTLHKQFTPDLLLAFEWIRQRVEGVFRSSAWPDNPPHFDPGVVVDGGWKKSGCKYSWPQVRHRPQYPNMPSNVSREPKDRGGLCNKFYSEYGESKLTGGIMAAWCTHSICYGFHFILESEGRNDVFSALITRWLRAPKYVIYDFACQLAPYCRAREPEFFADTTFLIDDFHALGHTRCSTAFFLKMYAQTQPLLGRVNSSTAECGNGGLSKIRKSLQYMGQDRAILYTSVFISIWNRLKILRM